MSDIRAHRPAHAAPITLAPAGADRFALPLDASLCTGAPDDRHMFGGAGAAAAVLAMEALSGQAALWVSAQFHQAPRVGRVLEMAERSRLAGRSSVQFTLQGTVDGEVAMEALGATGAAQPKGERRQWSRPETVPGPQDCKFVSVHRDAHEDVHGRFEARQARGRFGKFSHDPRSGDGRVLVWLRPFSGVVDRAALAVIADFLPACTSDALGVRCGGRSLDNLVRFAALVPTEWVLAEYRIDAVADGVGHGTTRLYAEDGTLLALGSQSFRLLLAPRAGEPGGA